MLEKEIMRSIEKRLAIWHLTSEVVYYLRTNSGIVKTYVGSYVRLAPKGTPDYIAIIRNKEKGLDLLFIEAKRGDGKGKQSLDQIKFQHKYKDIDNVHYLLIDHPDFLDIYLDNICIDRIKEIKL